MWLIFIIRYSIICLGISLIESFRARNSLFLHEFEPKESRRATKVNWICIYIFRFFGAYIITNLRVNMNHFFRPVKSHSDGFINYLKYQINLYASKTSFWLFFWNFNWDFNAIFEILTGYLNSEIQRFLTLFSFYLVNRSECVYPGIDNPFSRHW